MIVLIWIFGFFSFLAVLIGAFRDDYINLAIYTKTFLSLDEKIHKTHQKKLQAAFDALIATSPRKEKEDKPDKPKNEPSVESQPTKKKIYLEVIPHASRFNLAVFFKKGQEKYKEALLRLLKTSLGSYAENFAAELVQKGQWLRATSKKLNPEKVVILTLRDLAKIPFAEREVVYKALKEGLQEKCLFEAGRNRYNISVHYASVEVLTAVLDDEELALALVTARTEKYLAGKRVLKSNQKTVVSDQFLEEKPLKELFKAHGKDVDDYKDILDIAVHQLHRADLPKDFGLPVDEFGS